MLSQDILLCDKSLTQTPSLITRTWGDSWITLNLEAISLEISLCLIKSNKKQPSISLGSFTDSILFLAIELIEHLVECLKSKTFLSKDDLIKWSKPFSLFNSIQLKEEDENQPMKVF